MNVTPQDAVQTYPELAEIAALQAAGWRFMALRRDDELAGFVGVRQAGEDSIDALYVFDRHDCRAVRLIADAPGTPGGIVWEYHGALADAIHEVRSLPAPDDRLAPTLIKRVGSLLHW